MICNRNKIYALLLMASVAGYGWLYYTLANNTNESSSGTVCFLKKMTTIPCPSCGTTRSVILVTKGDFSGALYLNPLGYLAALFLLIIPFWIGYDSVRRSSSLFDFYQKIELQLKKPTIAIPLVVLVLFNWIWNITKGL